MSKAERTILILGDANSVFIKDFAAQFIKRGNVVDVFSFHKAPPIPNVRKYYEHDTSRYKNRLTRPIHLWINLKKDIQAVQVQYDVIVLHFVYYFLAFCLTTLRLKTNRLVAVIWGSDFYRSSHVFAPLKRLIYKTVDAIVFTNPLTLEKFHEEYSCIPREKTSVARFGLPVLDEIQKQRHIDLSDFAEALALPLNKIRVVVGYNASPLQRQTAIIEALQALPHQELDKFHFVFPLGAKNTSIEGDIRQHCTVHNIQNYTILTDFFDVKTVAKLRLLTDVLINIQPSDQFSGSMQETLYAGGYVIAGRWLPYEEIIKAGASIYLVDAPGDIPNTLLHRMPDPFRRTSHAGWEYIEQRSSWKSAFKTWDHLLFPRP